MIGAVHNKILSYISLTFIAAVLALAPFSPTFHYQNAHAGGPAGGATEATQILNNIELIALNATAAANSAFNSVTAWATNLLGLKEFTLDGLAWAAINIILEEMIRSVTAWVNAGFPSGGPAFVQDLGGFLLNIADGIAGDFILNNTNLGFLCSPFQLDIQFALTGQYLDSRPGGYQPQCRITGILQNIQNFTINVNGSVDLQAAYDSRSFAAGGWAWWMGAVEDQESNVFGAYAQAQAALSATLRNAKGEEIELLKWGQGFLSRKECDANGQNCQIITPGQVIESQLNKALAGGQERLTVADEINELIAALFGQLVQYILGSVGLFNASFQPFADPNTGASYNSLLSAWSNTSAFGGGAGAAGYSSSGNGGYTSGAAVNAAQSYIALQNQIIQIVDTEEAYLNAALQSYPGQITVTTLPQTLTAARSTAQSERQRVNQILNQITNLQNQLSSASSASQSQSLLGQIQTLQNQLPTSNDVATNRLQVQNQIQPVITNLRNTIDRDIRNAGGTPPGQPNSSTGSSTPSVFIAASPNPIQPTGNATNISWTVGNATNCVSIGGQPGDGWSGANLSTSGGSQTHTLINRNTVTLGISCSNSSGSSNATVQINPL